MSEGSGPARSGESDKSDERDELRTIGFRLRELQRLLSMRVQQENRRLEADGLDPVTEATFFRPESERDEPPEETSR